MVSTHVVTTGFAFPLAARIIGFAVLHETYVPRAQAFWFLLAVQALGYIGGAYYSLAYIRKVALIERPVACIKPSIIAFCVLSTIGLVLSVASIVGQQPPVITPIVGITGVLAFYLVICLAFARITQQGFSKMEPSTPEP